MRESSRTTAAPAPARSSAGVRSRPRRRQPFRFLFAGLLLQVAACVPAAEPEVRVVDFLAGLERADLRPSGGAFEVTGHALGGSARPTFVTPPTSRVTLKVTPMPRRGRLRAGLGVSGSGETDRVNFRVGISDGRTYELLAEQLVTAADAAAGWRPLDIDLSRYAGPQWSLFYRPDNLQWEVILATTALDGAPRNAYWGAPGIDTDRAAARLYHQARIDAARER